MQYKQEIERLDQSEEITEKLIEQMPLLLGVQLMEQRLKSGDHESSSDSESALSSDSDRSEKVGRPKGANFDKFDIRKDKATKFSIRIDFDGEQKLRAPPYPLNIIDRSYLVTAIRYHTQ